LLLTVGFVVGFPPGEAGAATSIGLLRNDYNRDGVSDLVGVRFSDGCLARWRGNGSGGFTYIGDAGCGWNSYHDLVGLGDLNRDGVGDLVAVRNSDGCLARWRGDGSFGFSYMGDAGCGWNNYTIAGPGDFNGDGVADLIGRRKSDGCLARWVGTGNGGFRFIGDLICNFVPAHLEGVGDINGDGFADVLGMSESSPCVSGYLGTGTGSFSALAEWCYFLDANGLWSAVGMGDINRDGTGDFVAYTNDGCLERWYGDRQLGWVAGGTAGCGWNNYLIA
jgi:hypothetical protein